MNKGKFLGWLQLYLRASNFIDKYDDKTEIHSLLIPIMLVQKQRYLDKMLELIKED